MASNNKMTYAVSLGCVIVVSCITLVRTVAKAIAMTDAFVNNANRLGEHHVKKPQ